MADSEKKDDFDWKGDAGEKFAHFNPPDAAGTDKDNLEYFNVTMTDCFKPVLAALKEVLP